MTPQLREKTFEDIVRQAHAERARVVAELLATAVVAVTRLARRLLARLSGATAADAAPSHATRLRQQRAAEARRGTLLVDVGR